jgi:hypothetical protein
MKKPKSLRKFIRLEKSRIRKENLNDKEKLIKELYQKLNKKNDHKRDI